MSGKPASVARSVGNMRSGVVETKDVAADDSGSIDEADTNNDDYGSHVGMAKEGKKLRTIKPKRNENSESDSSAVSALRAEGKGAAKATTNVRSASALFPLPLLFAPSALIYAGRSPCRLLARRTRQTHLRL
jgi:hypothetical protein